MNYYKNTSLSNLTEIVNNVVITEEWRDIPDYEGIYQASSFGRIRSFDTVIVAGDKKVIKPHKGKILKQSNIGNKRGYLVVGLTKNSICTIHRVHRVIASAFYINNDISKNQVNHIDLDKKNNKASNLEWCSNSENMAHAIKNRAFFNKNRSRLVLNLLTGIFYDSAEEANSSLPNRIKDIHRRMNGGRPNKTPLIYA